MTLRNTHKNDYRLAFWIVPKVMLSLMEKESKWGSLVLIGRMRYGNHTRHLGKTRKTTTGNYSYRMAA